MSTTTSASTATATCPGCGKKFKGARGLKAHQTSAFATLACKPYVDPVQPGSPEDFPLDVDNGLGVLTADEQAAVDAIGADEDQEAIDAAPYSDARLAASLSEHFEECAREVFKLGEDRDEIIASARRYARVPEFATTLVHLTGIEELATPTAWRWHPEDAKRLMDTATSSIVVRITKHDEGRKGETVITDFHWEDGLRARVTEKFSI